MIEAKRALPVILIHFFLGFSACILYAYVTPVSVELLSPFVSGYRFRTGMLLFVTYMPSLQISGLLIGYALAFSKNASDTVDRWSIQLLSYLKGAFVICLCCISVYIVLSEGVSPFLKGHQELSVSRTGDYNDYMNVAKETRLRGLLSEADFNTGRALQIWPKSPEAAKMRDALQEEIAEVYGAGAAEAKKEGDVGISMEEVSRNKDGVTVRAALDKALAAEKKREFYNAHYFAMLAWSFAPGTDPNKAEAMSVASRVWNKILAGMDQIKAEQDKLYFQKKMRGYEAVQSKDYLKAYYLFLALREDELKNTGTMPDPDVAQFLEVARKGVIDKYFFIDETLNLRLFESARDVFFVIKRADGSTNSIFIRGVTYSRASGKDMAYLRDFEYARFDRNNKLVYQITVPYAKMYPYTTEDGKARPELMLRAVNRKIEGNDIIPTVVLGTVPEMEQNILRLDMPYADFDQIVAANKGASGMSLMDLVRFMDKTDSYGFSRTIFLREMIGRLADPFLMLIISIYALTLGWKYRLGKNVLFKAWWILTIPLFPVLSLLVIGAVRYLARICIIIFVDLVPQNPVALMIAFLSVSFVGISIYFFSQRSD